MPVYEIFIDGKPRKIELVKNSDKNFMVKIDDKALKVELPAEKVDLEKQFQLKIDNKTYKIQLPKIDRDKPFPIKVEEATFKAEVRIPITKLVAATPFEPTSLTPTKRIVTQKQVVEGGITAPMTGRIVSVKVKKGDTVEVGQVLCIIEAMKMENEITAPKAGTVQEVNVSEGSSVSEGEVLLVIG
jgi:biotin carboxyl carrier protein